MDPVLNDMFEAPCSPDTDGNNEQTTYRRPLRRRQRKVEPENKASHAASVASWLETHGSQLFECARHNGLVRLTMKACAERYHRAVGQWVDTLKLHENQKHMLRLSLATCAACPVGAYNARQHRRLR